ncbi:MAG: polysaccharide pyruvyl transferase family protein, partial [Actinomycetota bacterium]|nr:polysaccharide pyruvyl transferase family protein [Actinomycetota bacterium]
MTTTRALVAGWFSFLHGEATAGDLLAADAACAWLREAGVDHDLALSPAFREAAPTDHPGTVHGPGVDWTAVDPDGYTHVVFVCGPAAGRQVAELLDRFPGARRIALGTSVIAEATAALPFDVVLERDSPEQARPDLSLGAPPARVPLVGVVLAHPQPEYGARARHDDARAAVERVLAARDLAVVRFDTRVDPREPGIRSAAAVEARVARMDAVVSTRMHGLVLALRNGVPAVAVDPVDGGAKVSRQAAALGWP